MKSNLRINGWFIGRSKAHVLVIALLINFSAVGAEPINKPRLIEGSLTTTGQRIFELSDSSLQSRESGAESFVNDISATGPVGGDWIETTERIKDGRTELDGGGAERVLPFTGDREPMRDKPREATANSTKKPEVASTEIDTDDVHPSIWIFVAIVVASIFFPSDPDVRVKPNVKLRGCALLRSPA